MKTKFLAVLGLSVLLALCFSGCKSEDQMKAQIADLTTKLDDANKKIAQQGEELKTASSDNREIKELVAKLGNAVVDLKKEMDAHKPKARPAAKAKAVRKVRKGTSAIKKHARVYKATE